MLRAALLLWIFLHLLPVRAADVEGLFETEVIARSLSAGDRKLAIQEAMRIVLSRVVAGEHAKQTGVVDSAVAGAENYVRQYQYAMISNGWHDDGGSRLMRVEFNETQLLELLRSGDVGIWSEIRPETLTWLVVERRGKRRFYDADAMPELENVLTRAARLKGLPLIFPILDLDEQRRIAVSEVLSSDSTQLQAASARYGTVSVLAGHLVERDGCWRAEWTHFFNSGIRQWAGGCLALGDAVLNGMQGVYDTLSEYYGVKPENADKGLAVVKIKGIKTTDDRNRISAYLDSITLIKSVTWVNVEDDVNIYQIRYEGDAGHLAEALASNGPLTPVKLPGLDRRDFVYQLRRD